MLAAAARSRVRPRLRAGADAEDIVDAGLRRQHCAHARRADMRSDVQAHRACPMPWLPLCLLRWRRRQAAVRAAAKRARGCNSAKRSHLRAATVASRAVAARCVRSARPASPSARAASALRLSTPGGCFSVDRMTATRQALISSGGTWRRRQLDKGDAQERAVRKAFPISRTYCERPHCSTCIVLWQRHLFLPLSASTEPTATLRCGAICCADVSAYRPAAASVSAAFMRKCGAPSAQG